MSAPHLRARRRVLLISGAIIGAVSLAAAGLSLARGGPAETWQDLGRAESYRGADIRTIDGDTIDVRGERVRVLNIDAPEMPSHAKCWAEASLAVRAAEATQAMINSGPPIALQRQGRDRYGRTLALVRVGGVDLGESLVHQGLAARWVGHRWSWCDAPNLSDPAGPRLR